MNSNRVYVCQRCQTSYSIRPNDSCTACGFSKIKKERVDPNRTGFSSLSFSLYICDSCGTTAFLGGSGNCSNCGSHVAESDPYPERRKSAFGGEFSNAKERFEHIRTEKFSERGLRMPPDDHQEWLHQEVLTPLLRISESINAAMLRGDWSKPQDSHTQAAWTGLLAITNQVATLCQKIKSTPPPILFIAHHRSYFTTGLMFYESILGFISTLFSKNPTEARAAAAEAQATLDRAADAIGDSGRILEELPQVAELARINSFGTHGVNVVGDISLELTSAAFPELSDIYRVDPDMLRPLARLGILAGAMQDPTRRSERIEACLSALQAADSHNPNWIDDVQLLVREASTPWGKLTEQCERLGHELSADRSASKFAMHSVLDIFTKVSEGVMRKYGSIYAIAERVPSSKSQTFDSDTLFKYRSAGVTRDALERISPAILRDVDEVIRNAEAHYDYNVDDGVVTIRHLPPKAQSQSDALVGTLGYDDTIEQVLIVMETVIAMAIALLLWASKNRNVAVREEFRKAWIFGAQ